MQQKPPHTPNFIQKLSDFKVSSLPAAPPLSFHLLSAGGITPCLPQLPFGLPSSSPPPHLLCCGRLREQFLPVLQLMEVGLLRWSVPGCICHIRLLFLQFIVVMMASSQLTDTHTALKQSTDRARGGGAGSQEVFPVCHVTNKRNPYGSQRGKRRGLTPPRVCGTSLRKYET